MQPPSVFDAAEEKTAAEKKQAAAEEKAAAETKAAEKKQSGLSSLPLPSSVVCCSGRRADRRARARGAAHYILY